MGYEIFLENTLTISSCRWTILRISIHKSHLCAKKCWRQTDHILSNQVPSMELLNSQKTGVQLSYVITVVANQHILVWSSKWETTLYILTWQQPKFEGHDIDEFSLYFHIQFQLLWIWSRQCHQSSKLHDTLWLSSKSAIYEQCFEQRCLRVYATNPTPCLIWRNLKRIFETRISF